MILSVIMDSNVEQRIVLYLLDLVQVLIVATIKVYWLMEMYIFVQKAILADIMKDIATMIMSAKLG